MTATQSTEALTHSPHVENPGDGSAESIFKAVSFDVLC